MVAGEAGIGKTRLADEFSQLVAAQGGRVLRGAAFSPESPPYRAILAAMRAALPLLAALEIDPLWMAALAELIPELRDRRGRGSDPLPRLPRLDPESDRARLFEGVAQCLEGLAGPRPVVLILEDLHWSGAGTISLLEFLARRTPRHPLLILITYREEAAERAHPLRALRRQLERENLLAHLALNRLSRGEVRDLVEQMAGPGREADSLADLCTRPVKGTPFSSSNSSAI